MSDPNATVVNIQISRTQYAILSTIFTVFLGLISLIYWGIKDDIKEARKDVRALSDSYREAVTSGIKVQEVVAKAPTLEKAITETHDAVIRLQDSMALLNPLETHDTIIALKPVPKQLQEITTKLDSMQYQIHNPDKHK